MYGCAYDEVPADEALDLVLTLPPGSRYVRSRHPEHAWPEWRHAVADLQDDLWAIAFAQAGVQSESPRTPRPADAAERRRAAARARSAKEAIEATEWEPVEQIGG